jgi:HptB-dependent secretion and biofilm anti anti-sigma factor
MISTSKVGDTVHVHLPLRFDHRCVTEFQRVMVHTGRQWVIELSGVEYVDSAALGMLLVLRERVGLATICLRGARGQPLEVLRMTKFDRMFSME